MRKWSCPRFQKIEQSPFPSFVGKELRTLQKDPLYIKSLRTQTIRCTLCYISYSKALPIGKAYYIPSPFSRDLLSF